jgi:hypothetical protein
VRLNKPRDQASKIRGAEQLSVHSKNAVVMYYLPMEKDKSERNHNASGISRFETKEPQQVK